MRGFYRLKECSKNDLFLQALSGSEFSVVGEVAKINIGGVTYDYIDDDIKHPDFVSVNIFSLSRNLDIRGIRCKVTQDVPLESNNPFTTVNIRRCSLQFVNMDEEQAQLLWIWFGRRLVNEQRRTR